MYKEMKLIYLKMNMDIRNYAKPVYGYMAATFMMHVKSIYPIAIQKTMLKITFCIRVF